jgi:hypothetical protein
MDSTAPIYLVRKLIEDSPKVSVHTIALRTSRFCLEAKGVTIQWPGRVYRHHEDRLIDHNNDDKVRRVYTRGRPQC